VEVIGEIIDDLEKWTRYSGVRKQVDIELSPSVHEKTRMDSKDRSVASKFAKRKIANPGA
jgi:hypothetical protein